MPADRVWLDHDVNKRASGWYPARTAAALLAMNPGFHRGPGARGLDEMTVAELRKHAGELGVDLGDARRKAEIIAALTAAPTDDPPPAGDHDAGDDADNHEGVS